MFFIFSAFCIKHQLPFCAKSLCFSMTFDFFYQVKTTFWNIMKTADKKLFKRYLYIPFPVLLRSLTQVLDKGDLPHVPRDVPEAEYHRIECR